jgi:hypothetical protein
MPLNFPSAWRISPPPDGQFINHSMPSSAVSEFIVMIDRIPTQEGRWQMYEHFKSYFGNPGKSSSESWAQSDMSHGMRCDSENAPQFIEQFYDACQALAKRPGMGFVPDATFINTILAKHNVGYEVRLPDLIARELAAPTIAVSTATVPLAERTKNVIEKSLKRSQDLLAEGRPREAVQEILWLLETVATAFRGAETESGKVEGKYFNEIVKDLRRKRSGTTLEQILSWITTMHGYLSSPTGGGVRHGSDLGSGVDLDLNEAILFCNLTRSYISFLLGEYENLSPTKGQGGF